MSESFERTHHGLVPTTILSVKISSIIIYSIVNCVFLNVTGQLFCIVLHNYTYSVPIITVSSWNGSYYSAEY